MRGDVARESRRGWRVAHAAWAALAIIAAVGLTLPEQKGHPPALILMPGVLVLWAVGHAAIAGARWLAAKGLAASSSDGEDRPWPLGLRLALAGTGMAGAIGVLQILVTGLQGRLYPYHDGYLWTVMLAVWAVHGAGFAGLLLRLRWSSRVSAMLALGWSTVLGSQIAEQLLASNPLDTAGLLIAAVMMAFLFLLAVYLVASHRVKSFLMR